MTEEVAAAAAAPKKAKKEVPPTGEVRGLTLYSDGGTRPTNPGFSAFGLHGYIGNTALTLKGVGLGGEVPSNNGYIPKAEATSPEGQTREWILEKIHAGKAVQVMPEKYIDTIAVVGLSETNNAAEMTGVYKAMLMFEEEQKKAEPGKELSYLQIFTDSEYTVKGINGYLETWARNNYCRRDGQPISNLELWKSMREIYNRIRDTDVRVGVEWLRGHNGDVGNERTDWLATLGVYHAMDNKDPTWRLDTVSPADGYWKMEYERHPFLAHRAVYFNTLPGSCEAGVYYLGNHGKDEDMLGNRMSDGSFAVVKLDTPDPSIEGIREIQAKVGNYADSLYSANLTNLFNPEVTYFWNTYGALGIRPANEYRHDLNFMDKIPLTREYRPAKISMRSVEALEILDQYLSDFLEGKANVKSTEITDKLFEQSKKAVKGGEEIVTKLRAELVVGLATLDVDITNPLTDSPEPYKLTLTLGMDMLGRNSLKRLEDLKPQVYVITWAESDKAFRYATVVKAQGCVGIWAGYYSNLRLIPKS